jgi:hypothetical protein
VARGAPIHAAVAIAPPTDWGTLHTYWDMRSRDTSLPAANRAFFRDWRNILESTLGGPPSSHPVAYRDRSPIHEASALAAFGRPLFIVHGTDDQLVPPGQACRLAAATGGITGFRVDASGRLVSARPYGCNTVASWHVGDNPAGTGWPRTSYLGFIDGAGHGSGARWDAVIFHASKYAGDHTP